MKKLFLAALLGISCHAVAQQRFIYYADSAGYNHVATSPQPMVAVLGGYENLLHIPTITINGTAKSVVNGATWTIAAPTTSITAGNGISITGAGTAGSPYVISTVAPTFAFPTRTVNTNFTPSTTKAALVFYSVLCTVSNPLLAGSSSATVTLQYSTNGGTSWQDVAQIGNLSSVALAVTIQLTNGQTGELVGVVPANALTRINSVVAGTATVSVAKSTEVVY